MVKIDDKKNIIIPIITFLIGAIVGSLITLFFFSSECPECKVNDNAVEESSEKSRLEVQGSTTEIEIEKKSGDTDTTVSLPVSECSVVVDISGAVNNPGVYCFEDGSKIVDVVERAKGFTDKVAYRYVSMRINLSELITDHQKIYIPFEEDVYCEVKSLEYVETQESSSSQTETSNNSSDSTQSCININTATKDELTTLNGVGESTAQKIIDGRPYETIEDILNVSGIGESTYEKFKDDICV